MPLKIRFRPASKRPDLTAAQILAWADQFEVRFGRWPMKTDGRRGLSAGSSLPKVVAGCRANEPAGVAPS